VATYPFLARLVAEGRHREMAQAVGRAIRYIFVFSLAATAALATLSIPAVRALYERGSFDPIDTAATAGTVVFFALGIPMWGAQQILARGFYAREEMWAPVVIGTLSTAAALPIYWVLHRVMDVDGLALASTIAITIYTIALAIACQHHRHHDLHDRTRHRLVPTDRMGTRDSGGRHRSPGHAGSGSRSVGFLDPRQSHPRRRQRLRTGCRCGSSGRSSRSGHRVRAALGEERSEEEWVEPTTTQTSGA